MKLTLDGNIVLLPTFITDTNNEITSENKKMFGEMHYQKIDMADEIYIINLNGYIGESTKKEIEYAKLHLKKISYLEDIDA